MQLGCSAICSAYEKNLRALFFSSKPIRGDLMASMSVAGTFCTTFLLSTKLPSTALNSKYFVTSATECQYNTPLHVLHAFHACTKLFNRKHDIQQPNAVYSVSVNPAAPAAAKCM